MDKYIIYFTLILTNIYVYMQIIRAWHLPYQIYILAAILAVSFYFFCKSKYQIAYWIAAVPACAGLVYHFVLLLYGLIK